MRIIYLLAGALLAGFLVGCQVFDPMPQTRGGRVAPALEALPRPHPSRIKNVTVYRFDNKTGFPHGLQLSHGMTDQLITALIQSGHFSVVERATLLDLERERGLQEGGAATDEVRGTLLEGANLIFTGAVTELSETSGGGLGLDRRGYEIDMRRNSAVVAIDMRVIDVATGRIIDSIPVRRSVVETGLAAGIPWGLSGDIRITNALDTALRETIEQAVLELVTRHGAF